LHFAFARANWVRAYKTRLLKSKRRVIRGTTLIAANKILATSHLNNGFTVWVVTPKSSKAGSTYRGTKALHRPLSLFRP